MVKKREIPHTNMAQLKKNMQYPSGVDKLKARIEEINPAMLPRGNAWVVEEGQGADSVQERLH